ncbi:3764_t:CDS:1, partial [Cetraspora pellucida]
QTTVCIIEVLHYQSPPLRYTETSNKSPFAAKENNEKGSPFNANNKLVNSFI